MSLLREEKQFRSLILTNNFSRWNVVATLIFSAIIISIQIKTCREDTIRDIQEQLRLSLDSLQQVRQAEEMSRVYHIPLQKNAHKNYPDTSITPTK